MDNFGSDSTRTQEMELISRYLDKRKRRATHTDTRWKGG